MILIEHNNTKYMGETMIDSLANPIQCEDNYVRFNLRPKLYYPNNNYAQTFTFPDWNSIPVEYNGVLTCIAVRKPTNHKVENCEQINLTLKFDWDPYDKGGSSSNV